MKMASMKAKSGEAKKMAIMVAWRRKKIMRHGKQKQHA